MYVPDRVNLREDFQVLDLCGLFYAYKIKQTIIIRSIINYVIIEDTPIHTQEVLFYQSLSVIDKQNILNT